MDRNLAEGVFVGSAHTAEPPVDEKIEMYEGPLPEDRDPSFWDLRLHPETKDKRRAEARMMNARKYAPRADYGVLNFSEEQAGTQPLYREEIPGGSVVLTRRKQKGQEPVCAVYNQPVLGSMPLFVIWELPEGEAAVTTDLYECSKRVKYENPLPKDHRLFSRLENTSKTSIYESRHGKDLQWKLLGFVMPEDKARGDKIGYVNLASIVDSPGASDIRIKGELAVSELVTVEPGPRFDQQELTLPKRLKANQKFRVSTEVSFSCRFDKAGNYQLSITGTKSISVQVLEKSQRPYVESSSAKEAQMGMADGRFVITVMGKDTFEWAGGKEDSYAAIARGKVTGDFSAVVKVDSQDATHPYAKAGLMVRNDIFEAGRSKGYAVMCVTPENGS